MQPRRSTRISAARAAPPRAAHASHRPASRAARNLGAAARRKAACGVGRERTRSVGVQRLSDGASKRLSRAPQLWLRRIFVLQPRVRLWAARPFLQAAEPAVAAIRRQSVASSGAPRRRFPVLSGAFSMLGPLLQQQVEHVGRPRVAARAARCGLVAGLRRVQQHAGHVHVHACACACM